MRAKKGRLTPEQRDRRAERARQLSANPEVVARRTAAGARTHARPDVKKRHRAACSAAKARTLADPAAMEKMREAGRRVGSLNAWSMMTPEARARAAGSIRRARLSWCPEAYWPLNAELKYAGIRLAERKAMIAEQIAADQRAARAEVVATKRHLTFDEQLARVAAGAALVARPDTRPGGPAITLGGVATGQL